MRFIDEHVGERRDGGLRWGVESICAQLSEPGRQIAPVTYHEHRSRTPTAREVRDAESKPKIGNGVVPPSSENWGLLHAPPLRPIPVKGRLVDRRGADDHLVANDLGPDEPTDAPT